MLLLPVRRVSAEETRFRLTERAWLAFMEALQGTVKPKPRLRRLLKKGK